MASTPIDSVTTTGVPSSPLSSDEDQSYIVRRVGRRLMWYLAALYFVSVLDRGNLGFAALTMNRDLHLTPEMYSTGVGILFLGYAIFEVPSNLILARFGGARHPDPHRHLVWSCHHADGVRDRAIWLLFDPRFAGPGRSWPDAWRIPVSELLDSGLIPGALQRRVLLCDPVCLRVLPHSSPARSCALMAVLIYQAGNGCSCWKDCRRWRLASSAFFT